MTNKIKFLTGFIIVTIIILIIFLLHKPPPSPGPSPPSPGPSPPSPGPSPPSPGPSPPSPGPSPPSPGPSPPSPGPSPPSPICTAKDCSKCDKDICPVIGGCTIGTDDKCTLLKEPENCKDYKCIGCIDNCDDDTCSKNINPCNVTAPICGYDNPCICESSCVKTNDYPKPWCYVTDKNCTGIKGDKPKVSGNKYWIECNNNSYYNGSACAVGPNLLNKDGISADWKKAYKTGFKCVSEPIVTGSKTNTPWCYTDSSDTSYDVSKPRPWGYCTGNIMSIFSEIGKIGPSPTTCSVKKPDNIEASNQYKYPQECTGTIPGCLGNYTCLYDKDNDKYSLRCGICDENLFITLQDGSCYPIPLALAGNKLGNVQPSIPQNILNDYKKVYLDKFFKDNCTGKDAFNEDIFYEAWHIGKYNEAANYVGTNCNPNPLLDNGGYTFV